MAKDTTIEKLLLIGGAGFLGYKFLWPMIGPRLGVVVNPPVGTVSTTPTTGSGQPASLANTKWPLGIRNNNPGNIRFNAANKWVGQTGSNGGYAVFSAPEYGIRAMFSLLRTYVNTHGLDTIAKIGSRWAPASENNTAAWSSNVALFSGIAQNAKINPSDQAQMTKLAKGIAGAENGAAYVSHYPANVYSKAWGL